MDIRGRNFQDEFVFQTSRSGGPGGQNVNKVSTKVELRFSVTESNLLTDEEKSVLLDKLSSKITRDGELILVSQSERSQLKNKEVVIDRFFRLIQESLTPQKERKATKPTLASRLKRVESKKAKSIIKMLRRGPLE